MEKPKWTFWLTPQIVGLGCESDSRPLLTFLCNTANREVTIQNFFFKSSNGFHTGHIGRPGIQKKEISFDIMFTFLINRIKKKQNRLRVKSLSYTAECMRFVNMTFRHSECFYFTVQFWPCPSGRMSWSLTLGSQATFWGSQWARCLTKVPTANLMLIPHLLRQMGRVCQFQWMPQLTVLIF